MVSPKPLGKYPAEYFELFRRVIQEHRVRIPSGTPLKAKRYRSHLYAFRNALQLYGGDEHAELVVASPALSMSIEGDVLVVEISEGSTHERYSAES